MPAPEAVGGNSLIGAPFESKRRGAHDVSDGSAWIAAAFGQVQRLAPRPHLITPAINEKRKIANRF